MSERAAYLKRTYKLSEDEYWAIAQSQNYSCAVCHEQNPPGRDGEPENLAVDHNHATGANRALLCQRCNKVLGLLRDSQELLFRLLEYLRKHDGSAIPYIPDNPQTRAAREAAWEESIRALSEGEAPAGAAIWGTEPGTVAWLYGESLEPGDGRSLVKDRQKMRRIGPEGKELLARVAKQLGVTPEPFAPLPLVIVALAGSQTPSRKSLRHYGRRAPIMSW